MSATLEVKGLTVTFGGVGIVDNVSFSAGAGEWLMIVGPNGAGKSTVINAVSRGVDFEGEVFFRGEDVKRQKPAKLARSMGVLAQSHHVAYSFTVHEVVKLGRYAYSGGVLSQTTDEDERKIEEALKMTGMAEFSGQSVLTLSGGELQRTFLAQLFAQDPQLLLLDEPTNHLDLVFQKQMFGLIKDWISETGKTVVSVVHDLSLAKAFGTDALLLDRGRAVALGKIDEVLTRENLKKVYSMDVYEWMREMLSQWKG